MGDRDVIIVKFRGKVAQADRCEQLRERMGDDVEAVEPLFPDDKELELANLFQVRVRRAERVADVADVLAAEEDVEYANAPAQRAPKKRRKRRPKPR